MEQKSLFHLYGTSHRDFIVNDYPVLHNEKHENHLLRFVKSCTMM